MSDTRPADESIGAATLLEVLEEVAQAGFGSQLVVIADGDIRCAKCGTTEAIENFDIAGFRRLEGASDPADMLIVIWGTCSGCDGGGVATIGYGPNADDADIAALQRLDLDALT